MSKVFIIALPEEVNYVNWINDDKIIYCGVGKINATIAACDAYKQGYNEIINIGSCGSLKHEPGTIIKVGSVFQDIDIRPLCEYGYTFNELNKDIIISESKMTCFTTDYFIDLSNSNKYSDEYLEMIHECDIFDMECFAIAKVCEIYGMKFTSYKWVSDNGDGSAWEENCKIGFNSVINLL